jgi:hypothetical protein
MPAAKAPRKKTTGGAARKAADARRRHLESEVKRILAERDPGEMLEAMRLNIDEIPRDQVAFQRELLELAGARYAELTRGRKG